MMIGRLVAWVLLLAALIVLCRDLIGWYDTGHYAPIALGALWANLAPGTHAAAQDAVREHVAGWLWDSVATALLALPAWAAFAALGLVLLYLFRRRELRQGRARRRRGWR